MEQTALRPKPMPGQEPGGSRPDGPARRPHAARRRGRRLTTLLLGLLAGTLLVLSGVGLGTVGVTVPGMSKLAELQRQTPQRAPGPVAPGGPSASARPGPSAPPGAPAPSPSTAGAMLGLEVVDAGKPGALVVGVHVPGPGHSAGLSRGDLLLTFDGTRIDSAADLARAVGQARPGEEITLTVRHESGGYQQLTAVPGLVT
ncbi:PDZ domain-containing protein [Streptomyces sp.]|uniref:PDZ domain-containing protein n=1 Tax=Streptomyces sp. TaxID=1931 RepID=UPI002D3CF015|nr:PDZ domain-containing protein [Streptomyces sp.]HZF92952.1 PDZ domain-containing protein [Streptomyces sp.]